MIICRYKSENKLSGGQGYVLRDHLGPAAREAHSLSGLPSQVLKINRSSCHQPHQDANNSACPRKPKVLSLKAAYLVKIVCPHHCNLCAGKPETSPCLESNGKYRGSEIHKPGKAMIQREAALLGSSKLKSTRGNRAAAASPGWCILTLLDLLPDVWIGPPARPGNHSPHPHPWSSLTCTSLLFPADMHQGSRRREISKKLGRRGCFIKGLTLTWKQFPQPCFLSHSTNLLTSHPLHFIVFNSNYRWLIIKW